MESIWLEYGWTLLILIGLEGLLSADNALVMAVIAKHLPEEEKEKAIRYGILMAFGLRFVALFAISFIANVWQIQAIGAAYLLYLGIRHVVEARFGKENENVHKEEEAKAAGKGFWPTTGKIAIADLAFAIDSILAAVALALALPNSPLGNFGGMDGGKFIIILLGSIAGLVLIKYAASWFIHLLEKRPSLETTAYTIVAWVGVKLAVITLAHKDIGILDHHFPHSTVWTLTFYGVLVAIALIGWFAPREKVHS
ncbi:TerC family protein [Sediminibacillus massiliensis]|uniref:TerC family protein n=1 Tax=Sediminibacillus massiliensis TaxID=1926277 RepID=UPI000988477E|nr:TerC family protein [Sediminibacillus massiliensis]